MEKAAEWLALAARVRDVLGLVNTACFPRLEWRLYRNIYCMDALGAIFCVDVLECTARTGQGCRSIFATLVPSPTRERDFDSVLPELCSSLFGIEDVAVH